MSDLRAIMNYPHDARNLPPSYSQPPPYATSSPEFTTPPSYPPASTGWQAPTLTSPAITPDSPPARNHAVAHNVAGDFNVNSVVSINNPSRPPPGSASAQFTSPGGLDSGPVTGSKRPRTYSNVSDHREMPAPGPPLGHVEILAADMQLDEKNQSRASSFCTVSSAQSYCLACGLTSFNTGPS